MKYFDLHCDTATACFEKKAELLVNDLHISLEKGRKLQPWVQVYAVWIADKLRGEEAYAYFSNVYDYFKEEIEKNNEKIALCTNANEMIKALEHGKHVAFLSIEGSAAIGGKLQHLYDAYEKGVRVMTLTWNGKCEVADGCQVEEARGLTPFGEVVVKEMNRLGMVVDVSHLSEKGFWDMVRLTEFPFIATHSNAKSVSDCKRNLTDEQFKEIVKRGGLVGINFFPVFITGKVTAKINDLLKHIDHFITLGGEKVIAMGSDFDGAMMPEEISSIEKVDKLYDALAARYGKKIADQFFFENAYNFFLRTFS